MLRFPSLLLAGLAPLVFALPPASSPDELVAIPGRRVGPVTSYSSLAILQQLFGRSNVKAGKLPGAEGELIDGAVINPGTDKELQVVWEPEAVGRRIEAVRIIGKAWKFENGLAVGMTVSDVAKINGMPFKMNGFDWDYGGYARFDGGALAAGVSVRFRPGEEKYSAEITGNKHLPSTSTALLAANPLVSAITVTFGRHP